jgi:hypothetical protein
MQQCSKDINFSLKQNTCFNSLGTTVFHYPKFANDILKITELNDCLLCTVTRSGKAELVTKNIIEEIEFTTPHLELNGFIFPTFGSGSTGEVLTKNGNDLDFDTPRIILEECLDCVSNNLFTKPNVNKINLETTQG